MWALIGGSGSGALRAAAIARCNACVWHALRMGLGPITIFDKSRLQAPSMDESVWLDVIFLVHAAAAREVVGGSRSA